MWLFLRPVHSPSAGLFSFICTGITGIFASSDGDCIYLWQSLVSCSASLGSFSSLTLLMRAIPMLSGNAVGGCGAQKREQTVTLKNYKVSGEKGRSLFGNTINKCFLVTLQETQKRKYEDWTLYFKHLEQIGNTLGFTWYRYCYQNNEILSGHQFFWMQGEDSHIGPLTFRIIWQEEELETISSR